MKFIKILKSHRDAKDEDIRTFIQKNMAQEMINGLEYDDPQTIKRALRLFAIDYDPDKKTSRDLKSQSALAEVKHDIPEDDYLPPEA